MNIDQTGELLEYISDQYPNRFPVSKGTIKAWNDGLVDQDFNGVMNRAIKHARSSPHPPTISDLRKRTTTDPYMDHIIALNQRVDEDDGNES